MAQNSLACFVISRRSPRVAILGVTALVVACVSFVVMAARAVVSRRERAYQSNCRGNLAEIGLALHAYHADFGRFPPAYTLGRDGRRMHSWRVLLLPYAGLRDLYSAYRLDEPWDGPHNRPLIARMPPLYACPAHGAAAGVGRTAYQAVVGPATVFPGSRSTSLGQITAGPRLTYAIVETLNHEITWTEPSDLEVAGLDFADRDHTRSLGYPPRGGDVGRHHRGVECHFLDGHRLGQLASNILMADGSVKHISSGLFNFQFAHYTAIDGPRPCAEY